MVSAILCLKLIYLDILRTAQQTDSSVRYRDLRTNPNQCLLLNLETHDCKFSTKMAARTERMAGYVEVYPWVEFAATLAENNANLEKYGWPDYDSEGV